MEAAAGDRKLALVHGVVQVAVEHYSIVAVYLEGAARYGGFVPVEYRRLFNVAERTCRNCEHAVVVILYGIEAAGVFTSDYVHYRSRARRILAAVVPAVFNERRICAVLRNIAVERCGAVVEQHIIAVAAVIRTRRTVFKASCKPCTVEDEHAAHFVIYGSPCVRDIIHNAGLLFGAVLYGKVAIVDYGMVAYVGYREACKVEDDRLARGDNYVFNKVVVEGKFDLVALRRSDRFGYRGIALAVHQHGNLFHADGSFVCGCDCVAALAVGIERRALAEVVYIDGYRKFAAADGIMHVCRAVVCNYRAAELAALYNGRTVIEARAVVRGDYRIRGFAVRVERAARYGEFVPVEHGGLRGVQKFAAVYRCNAVVIVLDGVDAATEHTAVYRNGRYLIVSSYGSSIISMVARSVGIIVAVGDQAGEVAVLNHLNGTFLPLFAYGEVAEVLYRIPAVCLAVFLAAGVVAAEQRCRAQVEQRAAGVRYVIHNAAAGSIGYNESTIVKYGVVFYVCKRFAVEVEGDGLAFGNDYVGRKTCAEADICLVCNIAEHA